MKYLCCFLFFSLPLSAQLREVAETSLTLPSGVYEDLHVFPVEENTLLINFQDDYIKREKRVVALFYNENLQLLWSRVESIPRFYEPVGQMVSGRYLYHLSREKDSKKLHLLSFHLDRMEVRAYDFESLTTMDQVGFTVFQEVPFIYGKYNNRPVIEMHQIQEKTVKVLSDVYTKNNELRGIYFNPIREEIYVFYTPDMKCALHLSTYDMDGRLLYRKALGEKKKKIQQFSVEIGAGGEPYLMGTYNTYCAPLVEGLFFSNLDFLDETVYKSLVSLPSYMQGLSSRQSRRLVSKKEKGKQSETRQKAFFQVYSASTGGFVTGLDFYQTLSTTPVSRVEGAVNVALNSFRISQVMVSEWRADGDLVYGESQKLESVDFYSPYARSGYLFHDEQFIPLIPTKRGIAYVYNNTVETFYPFGSDSPVFLEDVEIISKDLKHVLVHGVAESRKLEGSDTQVYFIKKLSF
jgi:hypothetical protein